MVVYNIILPKNYWTSSVKVNYIIKEKKCQKN